MIKTSVDMTRMVYLGVFRSCSSLFLHLLHAQIAKILGWKQQFQIIGFLYFLYFQCKISAIDFWDRTKYPTEMYDLCILFVILMLPLRLCTICNHGLYGTRDSRDIEGFKYHAFAAIDLMPNQLMLFHI